MRTALPVLFAAVFLLACPTPSDNPDGGTTDSGAGGAGGAGGGSADGGTGDGGGPVACGNVTFFGECDGTLLMWCGEDDNGNEVLKTLECADDSLYCKLVNNAWGYDCVKNEGDSCVILDTAGTAMEDYQLCDGFGAGCIQTGAATATCATNVGTCADTDVGTCWGNGVVEYCYADQAWVYDCTADGEICRDGACITPTAETCNAIDDDGDMQTDEAFKTGGTVSLTGALYSADDGSVLGDPCGTGACAGGTVDCTADTLGLVCSTRLSAGAESCVGTLDEDCDGSTDEDFLSGGGAVLAGALYDADNGKALGDSCGAGLCATGTVVCATDGISLACDSETSATTELCESGFDEDCDGLKGGFDTDSTASCDDGDACTLDSCTGGNVGTCNNNPDTANTACACSVATDCTANGCTSGSPVCAAGFCVCSPLTETCNGADDDADSNTDEDYKTGGSVSFTDSYNTSPKYLTDYCIANRGFLCHGEVQCSADELGLECAWTVQTEQCNQNMAPVTDDDCDGSIDEDFYRAASNPKPYTAPDGTQTFLTESCGTGACAGGTTVCDGTGATCSTAGNASADAPGTAGVDDDCDGLTDEG